MKIENEKTISRRKKKKYKEKRREKQGSGKGRKNRRSRGKNSRKNPSILLQIAPESTTLFPFSFSSLSVIRPSLSKKPEAFFSLPLGQQLRPRTPTTSHLSIATSVSTPTPETEPRSQAKLTEATSIAATQAGQLPTPPPATTGHHFRRNHDQKNHLDLLYPKVLTGTPFITLQNFTIHHLLHFA